MMKKYVLFMWEVYEEGGGMNDFHGSFDTVGEAVGHTKDKANHVKYFFPNSFQVVDRDTWETVLEGII